MDKQIIIALNDINGNGLSGNGISGNGISGNGINNQDELFELTKEEFIALTKEFNKV